MKVLHCISQLPDHTGSGTIYKNLSDPGSYHDIELRLVFGHNGSDTKPIFENYTYFEFRKQSCGFEIPGMSDIMPYPSSVFKEMDDAQLETYKSILRQKLKEEIATFRPDVIWSHHLWIMTSIVCELAGDIPVIAFCHGTDLLQHGKCPQVSKEIVPQLQKLSTVILNGPKQQADVERLLKRVNSHFIGVPVDENVFNTGKRQIDNTRDVTSICYAGKISREKGVHHLLASFIDLIEKGYNRLHLNIFGEGELSELGEITVPAKKYEKQVTFHGKVDQKRLAAELQKNDVFILPSFYEGLGLVVIEALMAGCRVVCNRYENLMDILPAQSLEKGYVKIVDFDVKLEDAKRADFKQYTECLTIAIEAQLSSGFGLKISQEISSSVKSFRMGSYKNRLEGLSGKLVNREM